MQCPHCKKSIDDHANFCEHCGKAIAEEANESSTRKTHASDESRKSARPGDNDDPSEGQNTIPKTKNRIMIWVIALALGIVIFLIIQQFRKVPPINPPPAAMSLNLKAEFFNTLGKEIAELNQGRYYFRAAGMLRLANEASASASAATESKRYQPVAENYAKAWEHFSHARKVMDEIPRIDSPRGELCRKSFIEIADKYATATDIFNEYAKDLSNDEAARAERAPLTDAQAKYEIADQLMSAFLMEGCKGEYFKFVQSQSPSLKKQAYGSYESFYGDRFPTIQSTIQTYFSYDPNALSPTPQTMPSP